MTVRRLVTLAAFTAIALIIHVVEALVSLPVPIPGVKLGLANIVTLFMLFAPRGKLRAADILAVLLCRILLGAIFAGNPMALAYSLAGGLLAIAAQMVTRRFVAEKQIWACGAMGGIFHNIGQILAAIVITGTPAIAVYLPMLIIAGIITGVFTGLIAQLTVKRLSKYMSKV